MNRRTILFALAPLLVVFMVIVAFIHPYLAITRPSGGNVLVVEGWIPEERYADVAALVKERGYERIIVVGTVRPFSYLLKPGEKIEAFLRKAFAGEIDVTASGNTGSQLRVANWHDTLLTVALSPNELHYKATPIEPVKLLTLESRHLVSADLTLANMHIGRCSVGGTNVHHLVRRMHLVHADGTSEDGWPTYAHYGANRLMAQGIPDSLITLVPVYGTPHSRTLANASWTAEKLKSEGITACDVVTLGVHARRSHALYQQACGDGVKVGVISLHDPGCPEHGWWRSLLGWVRVLREVFGNAEPVAVELTR